MNVPKLLSYVAPIFLVSYSLWYLLYSYAFYFNQFCAVSFLLVISWSLGYYFYEKYNAQTVASVGKIVLVTGCDTGFGHQLVTKLDKLGYIVYAGVMFPDGDGAKKLKDSCSDRLCVVKMDVTKPDEVQDVVNQIKKTEFPLWAVVNNAGIGLTVPFDWGNDVDVYKKTFDVNVMGVVRVTKSCISLLRKSKGRIVNVASLAGRISMPLMTHYCMAKHSVRVFSDVVRRELIDTGIKVVTLEPTFYKTAIIDFEQIKRTRNRIYQETPGDIQQAYSEEYLNGLNDSEQMVKIMTRYNLNEVTDSLVKAVTLRYPKPFYRCCGYLDVLLVWGVSHLPEVLLDLATQIIFSNKSHLLKYSNEMVKSFVGVLKKRK